MKKDYDFILLDCMPSLGMMTVNALAAADQAIIPVQANYLSPKVWSSCSIPSIKFAGRSIRSFESKGSF